MTSILKLIIDHGVFAFVLKSASYFLQLLPFLYYPPIGLDDNFAHLFFFIWVIKA